MKKKKKSKKGKLKKEKSLKAELAIIKSLGKQFEVGPNNDDPNADVPYIVNFKHKGLQYITGGVPGGIFMEVHGPSQCGKSYVMYELGMAFMDAGGWYYQNDAERAYKRVIGRKIGLESATRIVKSKKRAIEEIFAEMKTFVLKIREYDKKCPILTAIDSYNFLNLMVSMKELEKEYREVEGKGKKDKISPKEVKGFASMRKNGVFGDQLKDYIHFIRKYNVTFLLLNQEKKDYSIMFGDSKTTNAEKIVSYDCSLRLRGHLRKKIKHKKLEKIIGRTVMWECIKSRHPDIPPFGKALTEIIYKEGVKEYSGLDELLVNEGRAEKCKIGKFKGLKFGKKKIKLAKLPEYIKEHPELLEIES